MSMYTLLQEAIVSFIDEKKAAGEIVDVNRAAIRLATKYPQTGLTLDEIADEIARTAVRQGTPLLVDHVGGGGTVEPEPSSKPS
jgi:hypothetical protein